MILGIEQESERYLEHLVHFARIGHDLERRLDQADHRRHAKAGARVVLGQPSEHFDAGGREADLFRGFAQRRVLGACVVRLGAAAGKAHLA